MKGRGVKGVGGLFASADPSHSPGSAEDGGTTALHYGGRESQNGNVIREAIVW